MMNQWLRICMDVSYKSRSLERAVVISILQRLRDGGLFSESHHLSIADHLFNMAALVNKAAKPAITFALPTFIEKPTSIISFNGDYGNENVVVSSSTGLHILQLEPDQTLRYLRPLDFGNCLDLIMISPWGRSINDASIRYVLAGLFKDGDADGSTSILFYKGDGSANNWRLDGQMACDRAWGRVQKMAYSKLLDRIYLACRYEHQFRGQYQASAIWVLPVTYPGDDNYRPCSMGIRLIDKCPSKMQEMAIDDHGSVLAISDWNNDDRFSVDLYSAATGSHLFKISEGSAKGWPCGTVWYPRGLAFVGLSHLYVVDGTGRIQRFNIFTSRCLAIVHQTAFDEPETIVIKGNTAFVIGSQFGRSTRICKGAYLTVSRL